MLFLLVGVIYDRAHHRDLTRFGGMATQMPWYAGIATVGFFASLGLPGLNGFISEVLCFIGAFAGIWSTDPRGGSLIVLPPEQGGIGAAWIVYVSLLGIVLAAAYVLWTIQRVYLGTVSREEYKRFPDLSFREVVALAPLAALCIIIGVFPSPFLDFMNKSLVTTTDMVRAAVGN
jgi:NADH-quinone oxidoreductase subunit M